MNSNIGPEQSRQLSAFWDYLMTLSEQGRIDDDAVVNIFNQYVQLLHTWEAD